MNDFSWKDAIEIGLAAAGMIGGYFTLRAKFESFKEEAGRRISELEVELKELRAKLEGYVPKGDLDRLEDRISKRLDQVSHDLKGAITQIIPALAGLRSRTREAN